MSRYFIDINREDIALWRVEPECVCHFSNNTCYFEVTGLLDVDYLTINMLHPPMSQECWRLINKAKKLLDKGSRLSDYIVLDHNLRIEGDD